MDNLTTARADRAAAPLPFRTTQLIEPSTAAGERPTGGRFRRAQEARPEPSGGDGGAPRWRRGAPIVAAVAQFGLIGLLVVTALGFAAALRLRHDSTRQAINDARDRAVSLADGIVAPHVTEALLRADAAAIAEMDRITQSYVVKDPVTRMKVWRMDGWVIYADDHRLIGQTFEIDAEAIEAARRGEPYADVSDLTDAENELESSPNGKLLEVYRPIYGANGEMYLYEHYQRFSAVTEGADRIWSVFAPLLLGSLILLELMQIPLAWSLARRVRAAQRQRVALLQQALDASDDERRRIARDLHDGVVQDLIGMSYSVGAVMQDAGVAASPHATSTLGEIRNGTQRAIRGLRTLLVDIYPASLQHGDLPGALGDLVAPYSSKGIEVSVDYDVNGTMAPDTEALVYRTARETLKNVAKHARATDVVVRVTNLGSEQVELTVTDNGTGFDPTTLRDKPGQGHVGLQLLSDLARSAGGTIDITSAPGQGTTVRLRAPR